MQSAATLTAARIPLASGRELWQVPGMKALLAAMFAAVCLSSGGLATTIAVVPIFEPLSLHGTDVDGAVTEIGEALQASVMSRPMALTGAFPEALVASIRSPHLIPSNNPNYKVIEANLLVLCGVRITGEMTVDGLQVSLDITQLAIPTEVDLTSRQVLKLALVALRKTLEAYQADQRQPLKVTVTIEGADAGKTSLNDLGAKFEVPGGSVGR
jgi:hypothetical protein